MIYLKTYKLTLPGPLPGLNEYINAERGNRYTAASMKVNIQRDVYKRQAGRRRNDAQTKEAIRAIRLQAASQSD